MTTERQTPRQTCTDHCARCGRHFHGLTAFDHHQREGECHEPATMVSVKAGKPLLQEWTRDGWCSLAKGCRNEGQVVQWLHPVTIYQGVVSDTAREFFGRQQSARES